jgi:thiol-disulfide isomerase/thioredoxin
VIEVQAVRTLLRVSVVGFCLSVAGCKASSGGKDSVFARPSSTNGSGQLFLGSPTAPTGTASTGPAAPADSGALASGGPPRREGVLAGRILDQDSKLRPGAVIQVIDLDAPKDDAAPLSVLANRDGYFDISGLEAGRSYRLVARVKDGERTISGSARVVPPNVRVAIWLKEEVAEESPSPQAGPAASLGAPTRTPPGGVTTPLPDGEPGKPVPPPVNTGDPSLTANVPAPTAPPAPSRDHTPEKPSSSVPPPPPGDTSAAPVEAPPSDSAQKGTSVGKPRVPFCSRAGSRVENFALYDSRGEVYELTKDRKGKLVLLDLWHTRCTPCIHAIPHLNKLHNKYSRHGLEVLGVAYEKGTLDEKKQALARATQRLNLNFNYRVLLGGGGQGPCPVAEQLELQNTFPTLILLDESGRIVFRAQGLDERTEYELEMAIYQRLFARRTAGR